MTFDYTLLILIAFILVSIVGFTVINFLLKEVWPEVKQHLIATNREREAAILQRIVDTAVLQAEQLGGENEEKKRAAFEYVENELKEIGLVIQPTKIDALIEATVQQLLSHWFESVNLRETPN
ncbi:MAG: hypothetical protein KC434_16480 [Anaerolineales bacterium]|nr:hypothetical protein [Anaerolineales bacterium]